MCFTNNLNIKIMKKNYKELIEKRTSFITDVEKNKIENNKEYIEASISFITDSIKLKKKSIKSLKCVFKQLMKKYNKIIKN